MLFFTSKQTDRSILFQSTPRRLRLTLPARFVLLGFTSWGLPPYFLRSFAHAEGRSHTRSRVSDAQWCCPGQHPDAGISGRVFAVLAAPAARSCRARHTAVKRLKGKRALFPRCGFWFGLVDEAEASQSQQCKGNGAARRMCVCVWWVSAFPLGSRFSMGLKCCKETARALVV